MMKLFKRIWIFVLLIFILTLGFFNQRIFAKSHAGLTPPPSWPTDTSDLEIVNHSEEHRGVWLTPHVGDISLRGDLSVIKNRLTEVIEVMKRNHLNVVYFHLRILNDSLYESSLAPVSTYTKGTDMAYLPWFIEECHKNGIEFHAWLNPYRIYSVNTPSSKEEIAKKFKDYPLNPASSTENILVSTVSGETASILDPAKPVVRKHIIDVCEEIIRKYGVDAIHFDDYFYIKLNPEDDQTSYDEYKLPTENLADFRRRQVDLLIFDLRKRIFELNSELNRFVQLGISPSGVWRNGDGKIEYDENGVALTNGSRTGGYAHYSYPLYSNVKKWVDEELIDYVIPQMYQGIGNAITEYRELVRWWSYVCKNSKTHLYAGLGLYRKGVMQGSGDGWKSDKFELYKEIATLDEYYPMVKGFALFSYRSLVQHENSVDIIRLHRENRFSRLVSLPSHTSLSSVKAQRPLEKGSTPTFLTAPNYETYKGTLEVSEDTKGNDKYYRIKMEDPGQTLMLFGSQSKDPKTKTKITPLLRNADGYYYFMLSRTSATLYPYLFFVPLNKAGEEGEVTLVDTKEAKPSFVYSRKDYKYTVTRNNNNLTIDFEFLPDLYGQTLEVLKLEVSQNYKDYTGKPISPVFSKVKFDMELFDVNPYLYLKILTQKGTKEFTLSLASGDVTEDFNYLQAELNNFFDSLFK